MCESSSTQLAWKWCIHTRHRETKKKLHRNFCFKSSGFTRVHYIFLACLIAVVNLLFCWTHALILEREREHAILINFKIWSQLKSRNLAILSLIQIQMLYLKICSLEYTHTHFFFLFFFYQKKIQTWCMQVFRFERERERKKSSSIIIIQQRILFIIFARVHIRIIECMHKEIMHTHIPRCIG
jgi:hypothetical protein